jgi:UDP-N-acetylglucosamine--N-acetylmuramyl-(pentapeptide) pyrophosphoryl-undecaprenol N-acetylglucosamine transferase
MRAIIAGGGTGGHVIPGLAIAQELKSNYGAQVLFIGTARGIENRLVPAAGFSLQLVKVGALKNVSAATRVKTMVDLPRAVWESRRILSEFRPGVVIGVGGYASGPAMMAAILRGIPTLAFEPNVVPGFANRLVARFVSEAAVHFAETAKYLRRCQVTGVPVRQAFFNVPNNRDAHSNPTLLVFGGSQGAHAINRVVLDSAALLRERIPHLRVIHQTGERDYNEAQAASAKSNEGVEIYGGGSVWDASRQIPRPAGKSAGLRDDSLPEKSKLSQYQVFRFIDDMPAFFARADLLLCRSGASTVAEVAAAGKPAILIPFPRAADDHQKRNAEALDRAGAAVMLEESRLSAETLVEAVSALLSDPRRLARMGEAARSLAHPYAARDIAAMAARLAVVNDAKEAEEPFRKLL